MTEVERLSKNLEYLLGSINGLISDDPKSILVNYIEQDGTITQKTIKNPAQYKEELLNAFTDQMNLYEKEIYIDPTNGDDSNTGNGDSPIKTFKEALNRASNVSHARIILADDVTINWSDYYNYSLYNKTLRICSSPNNTDAKLVVNLDGSDATHFGCMIEVVDGTLSFECDVDVSNPDSEQRYFVAVNGGKVIQGFNYGELVANGKAVSVTFTIGDYVTFYKALFGSIQAYYLYGSMNSADTSRYAEIQFNPVELQVIYPAQSYVNGNTLDNKGELAKWIQSVDMSGNSSTGFLLDSNNSNRATNCVCDPTFLQDAS